MAMAPDLPLRQVAPLSDDAVPGAAELARELLQVLRWDHLLDRRGEALVLSAFARLLDLSAVARPASPEAAPAPDELRVLLAELAAADAELSSVRTEHAVHRCEGSRQRKQHAHLRVDMAVGRLRGYASRLREQPAPAGASS